MRSFFKIQAILWISIFLSLHVYGQIARPIQITTTVLPPYTSDYLEYPEKTRVTVVGNGAFFYLQMHLKGSNGISLKSKIPLNVELLFVENGQMQVLTSVDLWPYFDLNNLDITGISPQQLRSEGLPPGRYQICFQAFSRGWTEPFSNPDPAGCSPFFELREPFSRELPPPVVIRPQCGTTLPYQEIQGMVFTWAPVVGAPPQTPYTLRIVEMLNRRQSPGDALLSATSPAFFEETVIGQNSFFYGPAQPLLEPGKSYAWEVIAGTAQDLPGRGGNNQRFANNGRSQPCSFTIAETATPGIVTVQPTAPVGVVVVPGGIIIDKIPHSTIKGKLEFRFLKSEENFSPEGQIFPNPGMVIELPSPVTNTVNYLLGDANAAAQLQNNPTQQQPFTLPGGKMVNLSLAELSEQQQTTGVLSDLAFSQTTIPPGVEIVTPGLIDPYLSKGGSKVYPGEKVQVDLYVDISDLKEVPQGTGLQFQNISGNTPQKPLIIKIPNLVKIGSTITNEQGEFTLAMLNPNVNGWPTYVYEGKTYLVDQVIVKPMTPYVDFPEKKVKILQNAEAAYNVGTINGIAKTYRFMPVAVDATNPGVVLDAEVKIFRKSSIYQAHPLLKSEGGRNLTPEQSSQQWQLQNGMQVLLNDPMMVFSVSRSSKAIARLFYSGNQGDDYYISISANGYNTHFTSFKYFLVMLMGGLADPYIHSPVPQYQSVFKLSPKPPSVTAIVVDKETNLPLEGLTATLTRAGMPGSNNGQTNAEGRFSIQNVSPSQTQYTLKITGSSILPYTHPTTINVFQGGLDIDIGVIYLDARLITVVGKVFDTENEPIAGAVVTIKNKPGESITDATGRFLFKATPGSHTLVIAKPGYKTEEKNIVVPESLSGQNLTTMSLVDNWKENLEKTNWFKGMQGNPTPSQQFNPQSMGFAALPIAQVQQVGTITDQLIFSESNSNYNGIFAGLIKDIALPGNITPLVYDVGIIILEKFLVEITVKDAATLQPVANAQVAMHNQAVNGTTGNNGVVILEDIPFGNVDLLVKGPDDKNLIPRFMNVLVQPVTAIQSIEVLLEEGGRVTGTAFADNAPLGQVNIAVDGMEFINAQTNASGQYILNGVPLGFQNFKATKSGFIGDQKSLQVVSGTQQLDFTLVNPGFAADKLLGFDIVLESWTLGADTTITGFFTNIPANALYQWTSTVTLPFTNQKITVKNGIAEPKGSNEIVTDVSQANIKVVGIPMILENMQGIRVRKGATATSGFVMGGVRFNPQLAFPDLQHLTIPGTKKLYLKHVSRANEAPLEIFASAGNLPYSASDLRFWETGTGTWKIYQFNFTPNHAQATIQNDGIRFRGQINITGIHGLNQLNLAIGELWLTTQGKVQSVTLSTSPQPTFKLYTWDFTITGGSINQFGVTTSGNVKVPVPSSPQATINFSQLFITNSGITSGQFHVPSQGLDIFEIVKFKTQGATGLTFGKQPGQNAYFLSGSGNIQLPKYIPGNVTMTSFRVQTNNIFMAEAKANLKMNFANMANITITSFGFHTGSNPRIRVNGNIELDIPNIQASAGGLEYRRNNQVTVDNLSIGFNLAAIASATANVQFKENGFAGGGSLKINQTPIDVSINFNYEKIGSGKKIEASFMAGVAIPVGVLTIVQVGGGFSFNTAQHLYTITVSGAVTVAPGTQYLVALDPISVTVGGGPAGPIFTGSVGVKVMTWTLAQANLVLNYPERYFSIEAKAGVNFNAVPKISVNANAQVALAISGKPGNQYWFAGFATHVSLIGLFNANTNIALGWGMNRNNNPHLWDLVSFIPGTYLTNGHTLNGFYLRSSVFFGRPANDPWNFSFGIGSIYAYFFNQSYGELYANFLTNAYGIKVGSGWGGGGGLKLFSFGVAGIGVSASGEFSGGLVSGNWNFAGMVGAQAKGYIGNCSSGCGVKLCWWGPVPIGGQICVRPNLQVSYSSATGSVNVSLAF